MAVLLVPGIAEAWQDSMARKYFVLNLIDQDGETLGMSGADHLGALSKVAGIEGPGVILVEAGAISVPNKHSKVDLGEEAAFSWGWDVRRIEMTSASAEWPEHDPALLARALRAIA